MRKMMAGSAAVVAAMVVSFALRGTVFAQDDEGPPPTSGSIEVQEPAAEPVEDNVVCDRYVVPTDIFGRAPTQDQESRTSVLSARYGGVRHMQAGARPETIQALMGDGTVVSGEVVNGELQIQLPLVRHERLALAPAVERARSSTRASAVHPIERRESIIAANVGGRWRGRYFGGGNAVTEFEVDIRGSGGAFVGRMAETANFGDQTSDRLFASIRGETLLGGVVRFKKTYDGTGGESHSICYQGRLHESGQRIAGYWYIGSLRGNFEMARE